MGTSPAPGHAGGRGRAGGRRRAGRRVATAGLLLAAGVAAAALAVPGTAGAYPRTTIGGAAATTSTTPPPAPGDPGRPPAGAVAGADISWPQCPVAQGGYANPLPGSWASFVVVGLSDGASFTTNPCLADQLAWARSAHVAVAVYVLPTYPTNAEFAAYGTKGPYPTGTFTGRLMNVGWQQAAYWVAVRRRSGSPSPMVWVDVEQKSVARLRWPARPAQNLAVLRGLLAGLAHAGLRTGVYTTASHWQEITGGVRLGQPEWRTVGRKTAADALATCGKPGLQGSPVLLAQYFTQLPSNNIDYDVLCPAGQAALARYFTRY